MPRQYTPRVERVCEECGKHFLAKPSQVFYSGARYCSHPCRYKGLSRTKEVPLAERFWAKVQKAEGCWLWTASVNATGYGIIGSDQPERTMVLAHRVSYEMASGPIPAGIEVCHTCDTPACVRPDHLFLGTHKENMEDMSRKGRSGRRFGMANNKSRLTREEALEIQRRYAAGGETYADLAAAFGVSRYPIYAVINGFHWTIATTDDQ